MQLVTGRAVPLDRSDVDTDQIIPSDWLKRVERTGFGAGLFSEWRDDRDFVLNREEYAGATILVAGPNFGTGSSREHAVWALLDYGFAAVVSPGFADIFRNNCTKAGLVPVQVDPAVGRALLDAVAADPSLEITIDVERGTLEAPAAGIETTFPLDEFTRDPPAQRLGRHRADPAPRGRHRGLRGPAPVLAAHHPLTRSEVTRARLAPARNRRGIVTRGRCGTRRPATSGTESPPGPRRRPPRGAGGQPASGNPEDYEIRVTPLRPHLRTCAARRATDLDHRRVRPPCSTTIHEPARPHRDAPGATGRCHHPVRSADHTARMTGGTPRTGRATDAPARPTTSPGGRRPVGRGPAGPRCRLCWSRPVRGRGRRSGPAAPRPLPRPGGHPVRPGSPGPLRGAPAGAGPGGPDPSPGPVCRGPHRDPGGMPGGRRHPWATMAPVKVTTR